MFRIHSSSSVHLGVTGTRYFSIWNPGGNPSPESYHSGGTIVSVGGWVPAISLWDGSGWNDRITLQHYNRFEGIIYPIGNGSALPHPEFYEFSISISGYTQIMIKVEYHFVPMGE